MCQEAYNGVVAVIFFTFWVLVGRESACPWDTLDGILSMFRQDTLLRVYLFISTLLRLGQPKAHLRIVISTHHDTDDYRNPFLFFYRTYFV